MARIDSGIHGTIVDAKRGQRPVKLLHPHTGPAIAPAANEAAAKGHRRKAARANARRQFADAFTAARNRVKKAV